MVEKLTGKWLDIVIAVVAVAMFAYHMTATQVLLQGPVEHLSTHLSFGLILIFLGMIKNRPKLWPMMLLLILMVLGSAGYIRYNYDALEVRMGVATTADIFVGVAIVAMVYLAVWVSFGVTLAMTGALLYAYIMFGHYLPEPWGHMYFPFARVMNLTVMGVTGAGMFGELLSASANLIYLFMVYGALLTATGAGAGFLELGKIVGRKLRGGPAIAAVVASTLIGMITGSVAANILIAGQVTIPLMKKHGFKAHQAGGIEAAASTGSQIMPPVMGASGFIMATLLGVPYATVMMMAFTPAFLYFLSVGAYVQFMAVREKIPVSADKVNYKDMFVNLPLFLVSLLTIIVLLLLGFSPAFAGFWAIISLVLVSMINKQTRPSLSRLLSGVVQGAKAGGGIAAVSALLGPLVVAVTATGMGMKISSSVEAWSFGSIELALFITFWVSILLGTGLITVAAYVIMAAVVAPALIRLGLEPAQVHFFILYGAVFGYVTPPEAMASLVASRVAGSGFWTTSWVGMRVGMPGLLLPFMIAWSPELLWLPKASKDVFVIVPIFLATIFALVGIAMMFNRAYLAMLNWWQMLIAAVSVFCCMAFLLQRNYLVFFVGTAAFILLTVWQYATKAAENKVAAT